MSAPEVSLVIPMHNEADGVDRLAEQLDAALGPSGRSYEVIVVDDGSTDRTWEALTQVASRDPHWRVIRLRRNFGQTPAMRCGIDHARGRAVVTMDGDLQNDPADIPRLLAKLDEGFEVVCGWRHRRQDRLWARKIPSMIANRLIGLLTGVRLHDYGCSLKAYRAEVIKRTPLYAELHRFITALVTITGAQVTEVKVNHRPREFGRTKYNLWRAWKVAFDMLTVSLLIKFASKPLRFFGLFAFGVLAVAVVCLVHSWQWYVGPYAEIPQTLPGVAVLGLWLAGHLFIVGCLAELALASAHARPEHLISVGEGVS